jgi:hypothetical protein
MPCNEVHFPVLWRNCRPVRGWAVESVHARLDKGVDEGQELRVACARAEQLMAPGDRASGERE